MILNLAGVKKSIADKIVPIEVERIINDVVREAFERFIEETRIEEVEESEDASDYRVGLKDGYNQVLKDISKAQAKWLKDNL